MICSTVIKTRLWFQNCFFRNKIRKSFLKLHRYPKDKRVVKIFVGQKGFREKRTLYMWVGESEPFSTLIKQEFVFHFKLQYIGQFKLLKLLTIAASCIYFLICAPFPKFLSRLFIFNTSGRYYHVYQQRKFLYFLIFRNFKKHGFYVQTLYSL